MGDNSNKRILICNDDGISARGIKILEEAALKISSDVWVVAPDSEKSASGHAITITKPLRVSKIDERHFAIDGTPTDCVIVAVEKILFDKKPDIILSGINNGANASDDVTYSGTVAIAMEGTLLGIPSIAFSQCYDDKQALWATSEAYCETMLRQILKVSWADDVLISVNFPAVEPDKVKGVEVVGLAKRIGTGDLKNEVIDERTDPRGKPYYWIGERSWSASPEPDTDLKALAAGKITVTPLCLDMTDKKTVLELRKVFSIDNVKS